MIKKSVAIATLLMAGPALAGDIGYSFISLDFQHGMVDNVLGTDITGNGYEVAGSVELGDNWFLAADYTDLGFDFGIDLNQVAVGGGFHAAFSENTDFFASLSYISAEASFGGFSDSDDGYGVSVGVRGLATDAVEINGHISYIDLGDGLDGTAYGVGFIYRFQNNFALTVNLEVEEDAKSYGLGGRYYFGS